MRLSESGLLDLSYIRTLLERDARDRAGLCLVEGERFVITALTTRNVVRVVVLAKRRRRSPTLEKLLERHSADGGLVLHATDAEFATLSRARDPHGVAAVVEQAWTPLPARESARSGIWLAFEHLESEGNLGTALRTAAAVGARGLILLGDAIDPYDPRIARATMGAMFHLRMTRTTPDAFDRWKRNSGCTVVGTSAHAHKDFRRFRYRPPLVVMMGCERGGLSDTQRALSDVLVKIPMTGRVDSLNVAIAASLVLYEAVRPG